MLGCFFDPGLFTLHPHHTAGSTETENVGWKWLFKWFVFCILKYCQLGLVCVMLWPVCGTDKANWFKISHHIHSEVTFIHTGGYIEGYVCQNMFFYSLIVDF